MRDAWSALLGPDSAAHACEHVSGAMVAPLPSCHRGVFGAASTMLAAAAAWSWAMLRSLLG